MRRIRHTVGLSSSWGLVLLWGTISGPFSGAVDLAKLDDWSIVLREDPIPSERTAADVLRKLLVEAGGAELKVAEDEAPTDKAIFVGDGEAMRESPAGFSTEGYGPEDLRVRVGDSAIAIAGGRPRGTLYGVYSFAERCLGVRFLTPDHTHIPPLGKSREIGPLDWTHRPVLEFRGSYSGNLKGAEFASRLRYNALVRNDENYGGLTKYRLINHSFQNLLPSRRYGKDHPEWYAMRDGKRRWDVGGRDWAGDGTEPCCTNSDVIRTVAENTLKRLAKHPDCKNISVSQNDNKLYCQCPECAAVDEAEGSHMGSLLRLVNSVAAKVEQTHPHVKVGTLAYRYSRTPPTKTRPRDNVQVQLCSFEACQVHALDDPDCPANAGFAKDLRGWSEICEDIYIWHYVVSFRNYLAPCANYVHLGDDIRFLVEHNVKGIMAQGAWNVRGGEFADLRNYVIGRMMWDPALDPDELMNEFLMLHYGKAAAHIRAFLQFAHETAVAEGKHPMCARTASMFGIDEEFVARTESLFEQALAAAESADVRRRVEKQSVVVPASRLALAFDPLFLRARREKTSVEELADRIDVEDRKRLVQAALRLNELMIRYDIDGYAEGVGHKQFRELVRKTLHVDLPTE